MIGWLRRWGWVIGVVAVAILLWILSRGKAPPPKKELDAALRATKAEAAADRMAAERGHEAALKAIEEDYGEELKRLENDEAEKVERLKRDPGRLARLLARDAARGG